MRGSKTAEEGVQPRGEYRLRMTDFDTLKTDDGCQLPCTLVRDNTYHRLMCSAVVLERGPHESAMVVVADGSEIGSLPRTRT